MHERKFDHVLVVLKVSVSINVLHRKDLVGVLVQINHLVLGILLLALAGA